ncbi:MAG: peptidase M17 [Treponema sp.]|nr:peptidase M17 [Treponema sp.]
MEKNPSKFSNLGSANMDADFARLKEAARIAVEVSLKVRPLEHVLIIANPTPDIAVIAQALYDACLDAGGRPVLIYQPVKPLMHFAEAAVISAFASKPSVVISISEEKMGKDEKGIASPYTHNGVQYDNVFHLQMYGEKTCRSFWSPSTTVDSFVRTVPIDYTELQRRCAVLKGILDKAVQVKVTAPGGTDVTVGLRGREAKTDDGNFSVPGTGGNLPAGETFISPENGTTSGVIAFDGSISLGKGALLIETPIRCVVDKGFVKDMSGGEEMQKLLDTIVTAETNAAGLERTGKLPAGSGAIYARNSRNIGELGIGLNPAARITGKILEDEKAFRTCHFAIGSNYDEDAPSLIHLDGIIKNPTITAVFEDGTERVIEKDGELQGI